MTKLNDLIAEIKMLPALQKHQMKRKHGVYFLPYKEVKRVIEKYEDADEYTMLDDGGPY